MGTKNISISEEAYERLAAHKGPNESFTEVIKRVVPPPGRKPLTSFLGTWKGSNEEFEAINARIKDMWRRYDLELGRTTVCLDTDLLVAIQRNLPGAREAAEVFEQSEVATTPINAFELSMGAYATGRRENIAGTLEMLQNMTLLPLDLEACVEAGRIAGTLRSVGEGLDARDAIIAGIVKRHGDTLVTRNTKHFSRVDGLKMIKW